MGFQPEDPLYGQTIKGPDGIQRDFKKLSRTILELDRGVAPVNALEQQRDTTQPVIALYTAHRRSATEEHKRSECGWICDGQPHYAASVCRICKGKAGPQHASKSFSVQQACNHLAKGCRPLSSFQRAALCRAFAAADEAFIAAEESSNNTGGARRAERQTITPSAPIVTSSARQPKGKKRAHRSETELDMEEDEALERHLAEEDRREYRPSPVSSVDEEELRGRCLPAQTGLATPPEKSQRKASEREERLSQRSTRNEKVAPANETPAASINQRPLEAASRNDAQRGPSQPASKKRKLRDTTGQDATPDKAGKSANTLPTEPTVRHRKSLQSRDNVSGDSRKSHARSAPAAALPHTPSSEPPKAKIEKGGDTAALADFGQLLKAANLTDLDELKAGLDRKRVPRFVGYLAETFPEHISSHLTRFNLIEAFESFLEDT